MTSNSLYLGNLPPHWDDVTQLSRGYGFANFVDAASAERARAHLNYEARDGRVVRVMPRQVDPSIRRSGAGNVFANNVDESVTHKELHAFFEGTVGSVLSVRIPTSRGTPKGYAFVQFANRADSDKAIEMSKAGALVLHDKALVVAPFKSRAQRLASRKYTNLYVKNIPMEWSEDQLLELFRPFGVVNSHAFREITLAGVTRRFGFVNFETHEQAKAALQLHHTRPEGMSESDAPLYVQQAMTKTERERFMSRKLEDKRRQRYLETRGRNLYVKNVALEVSEERLHELFAQHGTVQQCKLHTLPDGTSKGVAHVLLATKEEATNAITALNNFELEGKRLFVALHQIKEDRLRQMAERNSRRMAASAMQSQNAMMMAARGNPAAMQMLMMRQMMMRGMMPQGGAGGAGGAGAGAGGMMPPMPMQPGYGPGQMMGAPGAMPPHMQMGGTAGMAPPRGGMAPPQPSAAMAGHAASAAPPVGSADQESQLVRELAALPEDERKNKIGEMLYPKVEALLTSSGQGDKAPKVTGMLLEMDFNEAFALVDDDSALAGMVRQALEVLAQQG